MIKVLALIAPLANACLVITPLPNIVLEFIPPTAICDPVILLVEGTNALNVSPSKTPKKLAPLGGADVKII